MNKGKKAIFIIIFSVFAIISSPALSISFQILQDDKSETEIKSSSYYIEECLFNFFFDKGIIISNSPIQIIGNKSSDHFFRNSIGEAREGGADYFVEMISKYDTSNSNNPKDLSVSNIKEITWKLIDLKDDSILMTKVSIPNKKLEWKNKANGLAHFSEEIASDIYSALRANK